MDVLFNPLAKDTYQALTKAMGLKASNNLQNKSINGKFLYCSKSIEI